MGQIRERGKSFQLDYYMNGERVRETVKIEGIPKDKITRTDAEKILNIRLAQVARGEKIALKSKSILFDTLCKKYLNEYSKVNKRSWKRDRQSIKYFLGQFDGKTLNQLSPLLIEGYKRERAKVVKKSTVNRELDTLRNMLNKAVEWGYIEKSPYQGVKKYKVNNTNLRILNNEEFELLYNAASEQFKPILLTAVRTGMRLGEILSLQWEDINLKEDYLLVKDSKNYESRYIPIHPELKVALINLKQNSESDYVFAGRKSITKQWQKAFKGAGIAYCRFHDLRHTFGSNLVMNGVDIVTVAELMGHKDLSMTKRYSHPTPEHKRKAVYGLNIENKKSLQNTLYNVK
jgi:integrase